MLKNHLIITGILCIAISSCQNITRINSDNTTKEIELNNSATGWHVYSNTKYNYLLEIPPQAFIKNKTKTGSQIFFGNISRHMPAPEAFDIDIYAKETNCSVSLTGASEMRVMDIGPETVLWGKVDYYNTLEHTYEEKEPPCVPPVRVVCNADETYCSPNIPKEKRSASYALCAEKNGKTIVICVNQMTDNPDQAKQIFETFRWTE